MRRQPRRGWWIPLGLLLALMLPLPACGGGGGTHGSEGDDDEGDSGGGAGLPSTPDAVKVLAANDLGMHCMDQEFAKFMILPPYNVVRAQAVRRSAAGTTLLDAGSVTLTYEPVTDARGSRNSRSRGKTDFWDHVQALLGVPVPDGQGLTGLWMPADAPIPGPQELTFKVLQGWWAAEGIPITPQDDAGATNTYPMLRIAARDRTTAAVLGSTDIVVPVAQETDCRICHMTGGVGSSRGGVTWSSETDLEKQAKENVLRLHDAARGTALAAQEPVLCAGCHYSAALDLAGAGPQGAQKVTSTFSSALHARHAFLTGNAAASCYRCHPGAVTRCARGVMADAGMECRDCHGGMAQVAGTSPLLAGGSMDGTHDGQARRPWVDLPRCQSCHTGDARDHLVGTSYVASPDGLRLRQAWRTGDASASPISRPTSRFAENRATSYRFSTGHGGLLCQDCHGSTHAEWGVADPAANDNVAATQLQGHAGTLIECSTCHANGTLSLSARGPHGMHVVNDPRWVGGGHGDAYEHQRAECQACHGLDLRGTVLSRAAADRTWRVEDVGTVTILKGEVIGCTRCHESP